MLSMTALCCSTSNLNIGKKLPVDLFYVVDVIELENFYLITAKKDTLFYKFASKKVLDNSDKCIDKNRRRIIPGNWYHILDYAYSPSDTTISGQLKAPNLGIRTIELDEKTSLPLENLFQRRIYFSGKIEGLCIDESGNAPN